MNLLSFAHINSDQAWLCDTSGKHTLSKVLQKSQAIGQHLNQNNIKICAVNCKDLTDFVTVFLACIYHGVDVELPSNNTADILGKLSASTFFGDFKTQNEQNSQVSSETNSNHLLDLETASFNPLVKVKDITVSLFTSGSTGQPKKISRQLSQLISEVNTLEQKWGASIPQRAMFTSTVSQQHIYGLLFTVLWPLLSGRPVWHQMIGYEEILEKLSKKHESLIFVTSPAFLKRLDDKLDIPNKTIQCFSSGGLLTDEEQNLAEKRLNSPLSQIYGSSETGGIAYRALNTKWRFFESVEHQVKEAVLWVKSAHCYNNDWINTQDQVQIDEQVRHTQFDLKGRADRIVKIEEKRLSLTQIEAALNDLDCVQEAITLVWKNHRQSIAAVIKLNEPGQKVLSATSEKTLKAVIKTKLKGQVDTIGLPRYIRFVEDMPTDAQGKTPVSLLKDLFK